MNPIIEEIEPVHNIDDYQFRGKLARYQWGHEQTVNRIDTVRKFLFFFSFMCFLPLLLKGIFSGSILFDRIIASAAILCCVNYMNRERLWSLVFALLPVAFILWSNIEIDAHPRVRIGDGIAIVFILFGIYLHFQEIKKRKLLVEIIDSGHESVVKIR